MKEAVEELLWAEFSTASQLRQALSVTIFPTLHSFFLKNGNVCCKRGFWKIFVSHALVPNNLLRMRQSFLGDFFTKAGR